MGSLKCRSVTVEVQRLAMCLGPDNFDTAKVPTGLQGIPHGIMLEAQTKLMVRLAWNADRITQCCKRAEARA